MEIFYTPEDVEKEYGIETKMLANWRANLIGPDCLKWKDKILYHSAEIEEWFETQNLDTEPDENPKMTTEQNREAHPNGKSDSNEEKDSSDEPENEYITPEEVSERFKVSEKTLANWRSQEEGPTYFKFGNKIRYSTERLKKYFKSKNPELDPEQEEAVNSYAEIELDPEPNHIEGYLSPRELGQKFKLTRQTLANWRSQGKGPEYEKFSNKVYYPISAVDKWVEYSKVYIYQMKRPWP